MHFLLFLLVHINLSMHTRIMVLGFMQSALYIHSYEVNISLKHSKLYKYFVTLMLFLGICFSYYLFLSVKTGFIFYIWNCSIHRVFNFSFVFILVNYKSKRLLKLTADSYMKNYNDKKAVKYLLELNKLFYTFF